MLVDLLADRDQKEWFYGRLLAAPTWTFFALTEPDHGSDAGAMGTRLDPDGEGGLLLRGAKRYIGNGARPRSASSSPGTGPVRSAPPRCSSRPARPAQGRADPDDRPARCPAQRDHPGRRAGPGGPGARPPPAPPGAACGAACRCSTVSGRAWRRSHWASPGPRTTTSQQRGSLSKADRLRWERTGRRIDGVRQLIWRAASIVDAQPANGHLASAAKARAARLAEEVTLEALGTSAPARGSRSRCWTS
ncbi:acyl-CoA dehydrogenase family protein [Micromonospora sp. BRA006-A]|nr:acyl-CoA dehydrogenase family protein [Micromonospora sp. BRA006-A]